MPSQRKLNGEIVEASRSKERVQTDKVNSGHVRKKSNRSNGGSEGTPSPPKRQSSRPVAEEDFVPPPSGCFCFFRKPKPLPPPKKSASDTNVRREKSSPPTRKQSTESGRNLPASQAESPRKKESTPRAPEAKSAPGNIVDPAKLQGVPRDDSNNSLPPRRLSPNNGTGPRESSPGPAKMDSELDSYVASVPPSSLNAAPVDVRRSTARLNTGTMNSVRDGSERGLGSNSPMLGAPSAGASGVSGFAESNKMHEVTGIRFDRSQYSGAGDSVANFGDMHLSRLEEACKQLIQKVHPDTRHRLNRSTSGTTHGSVAGSSPSASSILTASMSQTLPSQTSFSSSQSINGIASITFPAAQTVPSAKFVETSITMTEVLQLQCRPKEAVTVLSRAIDEVNADMAAMRARKQAARRPTVGVICKVHSNRTFDIDYGSGDVEAEVKQENLSSDGALAVGAKVKVSAAVVAPTAEEYEQLRKLKAMCHRRIGSLYVSYGKYKEAEDHVLKYMSYLEKTPVSVAQKNEIAYTYSVLSCIYDQLGRSEEAYQMDYKAIEGAAEARKIDT